jgi:hypothetical protein
MSARGSFFQGALTSPSAARNGPPILDILRQVLPAHGTVLEIASGTGEHAVYFAAALPDLTWQPTDLDVDALASIAAHCASAHLTNLMPPFALDASSPRWPVAHADAIVAINMIHIAPWSVTEGLMAGAGRILPPSGVLHLYGPFKEIDRPAAPSNVAFDISLRRSNPAWGVRDLGRVCDLAGMHGLGLVERIAMPAHNLSLVFRRRAT